ncbi:MAG: 6,7-dimethyl-8-ribityllumazine synthase [Alloprevotella sp.]|nr:6,7-dimethyl-8-ribityllumazine synthase [Alloprevotella sp.]
MSTSNFQLDTNEPLDASDMRIGIVVAEWNKQITDKLLEGALSELQKYGAKEQSINVMHVPGSFELIYGCAEMARSGLVDAIIAIGCIIKGETPHFDYICQGVTQELAKQNSAGRVPVIYGVLTVNTLEQAESRCGGKYGNKGCEYALSAIKMINFARELKN